MRRIVIMNAKGGCGKTTVATNLASRLARTSAGVAVFDHDPLGASMRWVRLRGQREPLIHGVEAYRAPRQMNVTRTWHLRVPPGTDYAVVDTPAGLDHQAMTEHVRSSDVILIPVLPSPIDIATTADFIRDLLLVGKVRVHHTRVGIITNRVKSNTLAFQALDRFVRTLDIPVVAHLRETQNYVFAAQQGVGIHELDRRRAYQDAPCWDRIVDWLDEGFRAERAAPVAVNAPSPQSC